MSDDLGYEVIGCNGGASYRTPVLDKMAENGARFENAHVQPLCTPTRVQLMTGKYNFRNYIGFGLMDPEEKTFGHIFSDAGYKTCISGKWQLYSYNPTGVKPELRGKGQKIEDAGFDEYCVWHAHHTEAKGSRYKDPVIYENGAYRDDTDGLYGEDVFADYAIDFIERNKDEEFFVYFPMALTHGPFEPTPDDTAFANFTPPANSEEARNAQTFGGQGGGDVDDPELWYGSMVAYHDKVIGRVNDKLSELGIAEDTLVIYVGDNGSPQEVCNIKHNHMTSCGGKGLTLDRGTHVPMICSWPGTVPAGSVPTDLVDSSDFMPTILDAARITPPDDYVMDGRSFLPQLKGEKGDPRDWMFFHFEPMTDNGPVEVRRNTRFIRDHRWKIYDDGRLYDLDSDPEEDHSIQSTVDNASQAAARKRLNPIFAQMNKETTPLR